MAKTKINYWDIHPILTYSAQYYVIYGERSNGKTYGTLQYCLEEYFKDSNNEFAYIRRWDDDIKGDKGNIFNALINNGVIKRLSKNKYDSIVYRGRSYYLSSHDEKGNVIVSPSPFAYAFAISMNEHYKGLSYPKVKNIVFDEFLTRGAYLPDEFILFQNLLSTIIRLRDDVRVFMLGNTVNKYSPYIREMGLYKMGKQLQGTIDVYTYGDSNLRVAVEFSDFPEKHKKSNVYFAFNNPRLNMIKNGSWEIDIYPHYPKEYGRPEKDEIIFTFYIIFEGNILTGEIIEKDDVIYHDDVTNKNKMLPSTRFLFIHPKTTPIKDNETTLIYSQDQNAKPNYRVNIKKPVSIIERKIVSMFARNQVFYADNETGEIMRNYIMWCRN